MADVSVFFQTPASQPWKQPQAVSLNAIIDMDIRGQQSAKEHHWILERAQ